MAEVIGNPIPESPYREPARHAHHGLGRISGTLVEGGGLNRCGSVARSAARRHYGPGSLRQW